MTAYGLGFGTGVALRGSILIVGDTKFDCEGTGSLYVFECQNESSTSWQTCCSVQGVDRLACNSGWTTR